MGQEQIQAHWIGVYQKEGALWVHDGNSKRPHALLTSGLHSSGFFNSELVMEDSYSLDEACEDLWGLLVGSSAYNVERVVGPAMGAITLADGIARHFQCRRAYTEKEGDRMEFKRTKIRPGERVIFVEDVITTGGSVERCTQAVLREGGIVLPFVGCLVNRSGLKHAGLTEIIALIDKPMPTWSAEKCLLCKEGSEAIRPKGKENWERLNATYQ